MQPDSTVWNTIFEREGLVFTDPHEDMPHLADELERRKAHTLLDLGCGTGRHTLYFEKRGFDVTGIDSSPAGLRATQDQLTAANLEGHLVQGDIFATLPFADASFDALISIQVIHHARLAQIVALIGEMTRVLKDDGLLFISVPQLQNQGTRFQQIEPGTYIPLDGAEVGLPHHYFTLAELRDLFQSFTILDIHPDSHHHYCLTATKGAPTPDK